MHNLWTNLWMKRERVGRHSSGGELLRGKGSVRMDGQDLASVWTAALKTLSESELQPLHLEWLHRTRPLGLMEDTALLATPNEFAKDVIETRLRGLITQVLSRELGRDIWVAVTVQPEPPRPMSEAPAPGSVPDPVMPGAGPSAAPGHHGFSGPGAPAGYPAIAASDPDPAPPHGTPPYSAAAPSYGFTSAHDSTPPSHDGVPGEPGPS